LSPLANGRGGRADNNLWMVKKMDTR
jgi:hypothetical protein